MAEGSRKTDTIDLRSRLYRQGLTIHPLVASPPMNASTNLLSGGSSPTRPKGGQSPHPTHPFASAHAHARPQVKSRAGTTFGSTAGGFLHPTERSPSPVNPHNRPGSTVVLPHTNVVPLPLRGLSNTQGKGPPGTGGSPDAAFGTVGAGAGEALGSMGLPPARQLASLPFGAMVSGAGDRGEEREGGASGRGGDATWIDPADFVEFILNHESLTEEFCYMNRLGPYEYQIVPFSRIREQDYLTISIRGVTHYHQGEVEFITLQEWQHDQELYRKIVNVDFFAKYQMWKMFATWKGVMRDQRFKKCKRTLEANLFILDDTLSDTLIRVRTACVKLSQRQLIDTEGERQHERAQQLDDFVRLQEDKRQRVLAELKDEWTKIKDDVFLACDTSLKEFLKANEFGPAALQTQGEGGGGTQAATTEKEGRARSQQGRTGGWGKGSSSAAASSGGGREQGGVGVPMRYTEKATTRTKCRKLTKFIRMTQYLFADAVSQMAKGSTEKFESVLRDFLTRQTEKMKREEEERIAREEEQRRLEEEKRERRMRGEDPDEEGEQQPKHRDFADDREDDVKKEKPIVPMFSTCIIFDLEKNGGAIDFAPTGAAFRAQIELVLLDAMRSASSLPPFLLLKDFEPFTQPLSELGDGRTGDAGQELFGLITGDPTFQITLKSIGTLLDDLFAIVVNFCKQFHKYLQIYIENERTHEKDFEALDAGSIHDQLEKYKEQKSMISELGNNVDLGLFRLDIKEMVETLRPSPERCWKILETFVPRKTLEKTDSVTQELNSSKDRLMSQPNNVDEYVEYSNFLAKCQEGMESVTSTVEEIKDLARTLNYFHIKFENKPVQELSRILTDMKNELEIAATTADAKTGIFIKELESDIPKLGVQVESCSKSLDAPIFSDLNAELPAVIAKLEEVEAEVVNLQGEGEKMNRYQDTLKLDVTPFEDVEELKIKFSGVAKLWRGRRDWAERVTSWDQTLFKEIDVEAVTKEVTQFFKTCVQSEKAMPGNVVVDHFKSEVAKFKNTLPVVQALRNTNLQARHWERIYELIGSESQILTDEESQVTLQRLLGMGVDKYMEEIQEISTKASAESSLEEMLKKISDTWATLPLQVNSYKDSKEIFILGAVDDVTAALEESLVTISTIAGSRYVGPIRESVEKLQRQLLVFQETLDEWLSVQRNWMYLESIFSQPDIKKQLPQEAQKFGQVDMDWKKLMKETNEYSIALKVGSKEGRLKTLKDWNQTLDEIQKSLEDYLQNKRETFPRFFFLSNDELLEILARAKDPRAVQPHLRKCFDNLVRLKFDDQDITAMISAEGEVVEFVKPLRARGNVEKWLGELEEWMIKSLTAIIKQGWLEYPVEKKEEEVIPEAVNASQSHAPEKKKKDKGEREKDKEKNKEKEAEKEAKEEKGDKGDKLSPRQEWVMTHYAQVVSCVTQIMWCAEAEDALKGMSPQEDMKKFLAKNIHQLKELTQLVRKPLDKITRASIVALAIQDVHARDIVDDLVVSEVTDIMSFKWQQQLKYYWDLAEDDCIIRQVDARIKFGYEYMGATTRLVITPLTDRCWLTITGALHIKLGAAPAGPAGTGKTESTKDLAKALARQCVVFNCSDQIDYKMMAKLYSGVCTAGAWTCLDEFNRIDIEVLSVVAQQLQTIRLALLEQKSEFFFEGRPLKIKPTLGVFITMNPGYAGRTELPDNLKVLFRPVSMMVPDYTLIAEIMLFAEGFGDAKKLSGKFTKLFKLSSEQLSQQDHYDFGMRAVKSVLVMAGSLKRAEPSLTEDVVLIRAMRDSNVPKFLSHDLPLFEAIVQDLFPGMEIPKIDYGDLKKEIEAGFEEDGKQVHPPSVAKVIQLFETFNVRFGVMLVGPTTGGKTVCYKVLATALTHLHEKGSDREEFQKVHYTVLNPKCITMGELYGEMNELTQEWSDGLASKRMREFTEEDTPDKKWTVFDGPVDAIWIENMNTVLDDNMTLCLANGERIKLKPAMRMLFEVQDLAVASPATVSRCGMVYLTAEDLGWRPYAKSWLDKLPEYFSEDHRTKLWNLLDTYVDKGLQFLRQNVNEPLPSVDNALVHSLCKLFVAVFNKNGSAPNGCLSADAGAETNRAVDVSAESAAHVDALVTHVFQFSFIWSLGGTGDTVTREKFARFAEGQFDSLSVPKGGGILDGFVDMKQGKWRHWDEILPQFSFNPSASYFSLLVPNIDTCRYAYLLDKQLASQHSVFLTGQTGIGKTAINAKLLEELKTRCSFLPIYMTFSAQSKALQTQLTIESKLFKKSKTELGAPVNSQAIIFVDDVNMPMVETYGAQPPIELLRQFQDFLGFWDRDPKKLFWKKITDTTLLLCAAPPGGGRAQLTPRFVRHSHILCMPNTGEDAMAVIFTSIIQGFLSNGFKADIQMLGRSSVDATIELYNRISAELLPTPTRSHYTFNLRDVSKVFQGILMVKPMYVPKPEAFTKLWLHELSRVFCDRLVDEGDKNWFRKAAVSLLQVEVMLNGEKMKAFGLWTDGMKSGSKLSSNSDYPIPSVPPSLQVKFKVNWTLEQIFIESPTMWADFLRVGSDTKVYEEVKDFSKLPQLMENYCDEYNSTHSTPMNLVFFMDAIEHISRIARVLRQPRGNAMLVGVGGSGKQSLTRLSASIGEMETFEIALVKGYGVDLFREDEKKIMLRAGGGEGLPTVFLMTDNQIISETFLEDLNNILNSGEVPNIWGSDEVERIVNELRPIAKEQGRSEAKDAIQQLFVERVRENLHIVLCMSPVGESLRIRMRMFPSLVNCCTVDWFHPWPEEALRSVASKFLASMEVDPKIKTGLCEMCVAVHQSVIKMSDTFLQRLRRHVYTTPKSYLDLINLYLKMLEEKSEELKTQRSRLSVGLTKLKETNDEIANLKEELTKLEPELKQKKKEAEELLVVVTADQEKAEVEKAKVSEEEAIVKGQAAEVSAVQADAQKDLDVAMPALEAALSALDSLDQKDITEIKSFPKPPPLVMMTMEAVNLLLGEKTDWDTAKKVLGKSDFLSRLKAYDKDNIPQKVLRKLEDYIKKPEYAPESVGKQSLAAKSLCMWTHAMDTYSKVAKEVEPKKQKLAEMNAKLAEANGKLEKAQSQLKAVLDKVAELERTLKDTNDEKNRLIAEADLTEQRLKRAGQLTSGLADEAVRWKDTVEVLGTQLTCAIGDVFLSSGCISYYGPFTGVYRDELVSDWLTKAGEQGVPTSETFSLQDVMGHPVQIRDWQIYGLPTDGVSTCNGILVHRGLRWPLMIDPQAQANRWIKKMEESNRIKVTKLSDPKLLNLLEGCIRLGTPLLIEDVGESLDPALEPILAKAIFDANGRWQIRLGDSDIDYDLAFKLYITSKLPNPHYLPEVCIKVTIINFTVTFDGLEQQLLGDVVKQEIPETEEANTRLVLQMAEDRKTLKKLEEETLRLLSESEGNILDDVQLIDTLSKSKVTATDINERVAQAEVMSKEIKEAREQYTSVAIRGSILYFVVADLANIDPMYQFSLAYFANLFRKILEKAEKSDVLEERLAILLRESTCIIYNNVCRGLFERHKLIFSFLIATQLLRIEDLIVHQPEWSLMLRGPGLIDAKKMPPNPDPDRIAEKAWLYVYAISLTMPEKFGSLCEHITEHFSSWRDWILSENPQDLPLPENLETELELHYFHKLLLLRALREEKASAGGERKTKLGEEKE
uniref:Uncharacterized protein n=1 Tax=Chromera velia CCMP2878 TaxID=1169474 RepID=A0A0G4I0U0_9ALVE|eukprot:Cvel_10004.t1-p1 / transcript=Cvel_10004.t1 / gene=Cvel_10004 / organism=Chromera_velia_CCMP2878 / gene_product=Dynein heavy chain 6, axonemal, putative / transcript_product=Dynein heavy chain 6, axonemal, putative / location=Cvel_scaffold593:6569-27226(-) / protein_length=3661 / sequence_SO=supercontig / SO=protein_coding / is_pseudo=false